MFSRAVVPQAVSEDGGRVFRGTVREDAEIGDMVILDHELRVAGSPRTSMEGQCC